MMNKPVIIASAIAALTWGLVASTAPAFAVGPTWATVGAGCVPIGQITPSGLHINVAGGSKFNTQKIGEITLTCPITAQLGSANTFAISYMDPDGVNLGARVAASLRQKNRFTGAVSSVSTIDSNLNARTTFGRSSVTLPLVGCSFTFDHNRFHYYVQISIRRTSTLQAVEFGGVDIEHNVC